MTPLREPPRGTGNTGDDFGPLSARESALLQKAGERVFALSRKVATLDREVERLRGDLTHAEAMLGEAQKMRDILSNQVASLQREGDRNWEERAELRRLLASLQMQLQTLLGTFIEQQSAPRPGLAAGRISPQHSSLRPAYHR